EELRRGVFRKNERLMLPQEFVGQLFASANVARFDQGEPLPRFAEPGIVIFHAFKRTGEWTGRALRPQSQIDSEQIRFAAGERFYNLFRQSVVPFVIRESPLTFFAIEENEVDVGAVIQFPATKLAHAQNGEFSAGRACARASVCRILRKRWRGKLQPSMIVRPSCPPVPTPRPLRAKRCASFRALSTSVKGENSQLQLIPSCRASRPAFAGARGQTLKFRGAPANEAAPDRAAIVPRKSAKPPEDV